MNAILQTLAAIALCLSAFGSLAAADERPNILWIEVEDLSPWIASYGHAINEGYTPAIDGLGEGGVRFSRAYVPAPVCSPCRSAIITGVMQTTIGVHNHRSSRAPEALIHLPAEVLPIPQMLKEAGYFTFNRGKDDYNFHYDRPDLYSTGNSGPRAGNFYGKKGTGGWRDRPAGVPFFGQIQLSGGKSNTKSVKEKVDPASVTLPPYFPDTELFRKWWAHHYDTVRKTDADVRKIMRDLEEDGLLEETVVFLFSDHGNNHSLRHKQFCYEGGVHVPLYVLAKGRGQLIQPGSVREDLVSLLDVSATTIALAGLEVPAHIDGQHLFSRDSSPREFVISARDRCDYTIDRTRTVRTDRYRYIRNYLTDRPLLQPQYRDNRDYVQFLRAGHEAGTLPAEVERIFFGPRPSEELYDLVADPHEMVNLAGVSEHADELARHREILDAWIAVTDDQGQYPESDAALRSIRKRWGKKCVNPEFDALDSKQARRSPNVIYIMADDLGYGDLGCYGQEKIRTPEIDRLAAGGMRFTQHYAGTSVCAPTRCSLMTGLHTGHTFIRANSPGYPGGQTPIPAGTETLGRMLQRAGYRTACIGKWGLGGPHNSGYALEQGFDEFFGYYDQSRAHEYYTDYLWRDDQQVPLDGKTYSHDLMTAEALEFIEENKDRPFFLYLPYCIPHIKFQVPDLGAYADKPWTKNQKVQAAMITRMDRDVGAIADLVAELGLAQDTLILFTSDHGTHGSADACKHFQASGPLRGVKRSMYEGGLRVPLVAYWPGSVAAGATSDHISAFWDMMPTLADLAGGEPAVAHDGVSFVPTLLGETSAQEQHEYLYFELFEKGATNRAIRMGKWKGVVPNLLKSETLRLYDLVADEGETTDLAAQHPEIIATLEAKMAEAHIESPLWNLESRGFNVRAACAATGVEYKPKQPKKKESAK